MQHFVKGITLIALGLLTGQPTLAADTSLKDSLKNKIEISAPTPVVYAQSYLLKSQAMAETRRINVFLPPDYEKSSQRYPVLYLLDGGAQEDFHHLTGIAQVSIGNGTMQPIIIVGVENTNRHRDMLSSTHNPDDLKMARAHGGAEKFRSFFREELIPYINSNYRTTGDAGIAGESFAGLFVMDCFFNANDLFNTYVAVSPSLWWDNQALARDAEDWMKAHPQLNKSLYMAVANEGMMQVPVSMVHAALLDYAPKGLRWTFEPMHYETHGTIFHGAALKAFRTVYAVEKTARAP